MNDASGSADFKATRVRICRELEKHLSPYDVGTALHIFLADKLARCVMGADAEEHGELTPELEKEYQKAIEDRDYALREFGFDRDPLTVAVKVN